MMRDSIRWQTKHLVLALVFCLASPLACGPSCPEAKTAMSESDLKDEDATRVNEFVSRRKKIMEEAQQGEPDTFKLERYKFTVTAYELAIQTQLRIINLADSSPLYKENIEEITETRCFLDKVLKDKFLKKEDITISDMTGKKIQEKHDLFSLLFGKEGRVSGRDLKDYYKTGVKLKPKPQSEDDAEEKEDKSDDDEKIEYDNDNSGQVKDKDDEDKDDDGDEDISIF